MSTYDAWKLSSRYDYCGEHECTDCDCELNIWCDSCEADIYEAHSKGLEQCPECGWPIRYDREILACTLIPRWKPGPDMTHPMWRKQ